MDFNAGLTQVLAALYAGIFVVFETISISIINSQHNRTIALESPLKNLRQLSAQPPPIARSAVSGFL